MAASHLSGSVKRGRCGEGAECKRETASGKERPGHRDDLRRDCPNGSYGSGSSGTNLKFWWPDVPGVVLFPSWQTKRPDG